MGINLSRQLVKLIGSEELAKRLSANIGRSAYDPGIVQEVRIYAIISVINSGGTHALDSKG
jgi:hypothetical protein